MCVAFSELVVILMHFFIWYIFRNNWILSPCICHGSTNIT